VITLIAIFFISGAMRLTGVSDTVGGGIARVGGGQEARTVGAVVLAGALVSAFMNDIVAAAILLPGVMNVSRRTDIPPSRLLIPLSFGTILGGMLTLIGTPPNFLTSELAAAQGIRPFGYLEFTPFGGVMVALGALVIATFGRRMLPRSEMPPDSGRMRRGLPKVYRLYERLFALRIPESSTVHGYTLGTLRFGDLLKGQVVGILRNGRRILAPRATETLERNDVLIIGGRREDLDEVRIFHGITTAEISDLELKALDRAGPWARFEVGAGESIGLTIGELIADSGAAVEVVALERRGEVRQRELRQQILELGDIVHIRGSLGALDRFGLAEHLTLLTPDKTVIPRIRPFLFGITLPDEVAIQLTTTGLDTLTTLTGLSSIGVVRRGEALFLELGFEFHGGDKLIVSGDPDGVARLIHVGQLELEDESVDIDLESEETVVAEVVLAPRSSLINKTLSEAHFRERSGFQVLAMWHEGEPMRSHLATRRLQFGDALLLHGPRENIALLARDPDLVLLSAPSESPRRERAVVAVAALAVLILLSALNVMPIQVAAMCGALIAVLGGAITMSEGYREIEWRLVFFVAGLIPIGLAFEHTGAATLLARLVTDYAADLGPYGILLLVLIASSAVSQLLDGVLAVVLLTPVSINVAAAAGFEPRGFLMAVALGASFAFLTPFSHKANLLVMNPGGYRPADYFKIGAITTIICFIAAMVLIPILYPF
jgi:di/tricarboxylate transporter